MKNVLIVFTDVHLSYSPTTLNLFYELKRKCKVTLIAPEPAASYSTQRINDSDIIYFKVDETKPPTLLRRIIHKSKKVLYSVIKGNNNIHSKLLTHKARVFINYIKLFSGDIIAVDFFALWCVQEVRKKAHLVSLEIHQQDLYKTAVNFSIIKSVIIQSNERYDYLFDSIVTKPLKFILQNSPLYVDFTPDYSKRRKTDLIYCGSATSCFGIISCVDFIKDYPAYSLTIKGAVPKITLESLKKFYGDLITEGRLILDDTYLDPTALTYYVSKFRIGFAFYDFYRFESVRTFNYYTAPSGKIFQYLNSGLPIVANRLEGFKFIETEKAGVLISHLSSIAIKSAIDEIEVNYEQLAYNSKHVSKKLDFTENVKPFINYLLKLDDSI